ncbi:hypothetical protein [Cereibacter sphaeroides]|uniref:hypothetical protein n=1 Tax=Cereibacter sphaeroides TaxID=1063 RepID=UPI0015FC7071|nr:hypothetical protein [Cereibacter sphaeroides]
MTMTQEDLDRLSLPELAALRHAIEAAVAARRNAEMLGTPVPGVASVVGSSEAACR